MPETPEPLAAVLAEMRDFAKPIRVGGDLCSNIACPATIGVWADRIEAAAERERNAHTNDIHDALYMATGIPGNAAAARRSHALAYSVARRPWRCFDKSEGTACVVDAGGVHVCDATKADAELIVEAVNALAGEDTP